MRFFLRFPWLAAACALPLTMSACLNLTSVEEAEPVIQVEEQLAGPPLPAGSVLEAPGEVLPSVPNQDDVLGSLRPDNATPEERVPHIINRGRIIVGIDQSQNLLSYRDPITGDLAGFEVDIAREIARDILGTPNAVDFRFVDSSNRARALAEKDVDAVIRTVTITKARQDEVQFSTPYLASTTRILTTTDAPITGLDDLPGRTVCVADDTTALEKARLMAPESPLLRTRLWADCLLAIQQRHADAIIGDAVILSGIAEQDEYTHIVGDPIGNDNYGVAMALGNDGLTRQINATIQRMLSDGSWSRLYNHWFGRYLPPISLPAHYREETREEQGDER